MSIKSDQPIHADAPRAWLALCLLCFPTAVLALDMSALYLALTHIAASLDTTSVEELWILDIYPLMIAGFLIPMGGMGDRWGNRRVLLIGSTFFAILSAIASMAPTATALIAIRAALGIAGASLMPATLGLISELFQNPQHRRQAISIWTAAFMAGFALGPIIGGALLEFFAWGAIFLLALPVILPLLIAGPIIFPRGVRPESQTRYDWLSSILFLAAIFPFVYGLKELAITEQTLSASLSLLWGILLGSVFVMRQLKVSNPLLDLKLIVANAEVATALTILLLGPAIVGGLTLFVPQYLQLTYGLSAVAAGTAIAPASVGLIIGALISPALARKMGSSGSVIGTGFLVMSAGLITIAFGVQLGPVWVVAGFVLVYLGCGPFDALGTDIVISLAPEGKSASASAASETATELGMGLGIAIFGTLGAAIYQRFLAGHLIDSDMDSSVIEHSVHSFSVAITEASLQGGAEGVYLREQATAAFASGFAVVAGSSVILALALSILSFVYLRKTA
ncbi:DHA2 family multidrug resistance protein-like MFS transporter [Erwinia toletana]|uniref:DHA2 family multidrug resistance protein-like MFS transporter n=1 Tax=Winslowiella toletana TaxID=92490 RepID=A0ABS4P5Y5_9GAMM|nr:MFS transporter [Winslowiella toletana]MBP2167383.1 DHA2 family multidrug resistance protein-like MFS transporter [Winslowiella toletana]